MYVFLVKCYRDEGDETYLDTGMVTYGELILFVHSKFN